MEFVDLKAQYSALKKEIDAGVMGVMAHGRYIMGPEVAQLEEALCRSTGSKYCVTCANGTDALQMALMVWGIGPGDAVFVPSFTFMSTAEVVSLVGATPVFVDIEADTFNIDPNCLEAAIERVISEGKLSAKAIIPVDLFGQCADYDRIIPIARKHGLYVLEDGAQGFGGTINGRKACTFGDISTTSFFPAKPLGCYGDGGAVFTDNEEWYELLKSIRIHGKGTMKYDNVRVGLNARLDTMQAAILLPKLRAFDEYELAARQKWADMYSSLLGGELTVPTLPEGFTSSWAQYTIMLDPSHDREAIQAELKAQGIPTMVYYWRGLHQQPSYAHLGYEAGSLPVCEEACRRVLSLPMHPYLDEESVKTVAAALLKACGRE